MDILQRCRHPFLESLRSKANLPGLQGLEKLLDCQLHAALCCCSIILGALGIKEPQWFGVGGTLEMTQLQPCHPQQGCWMCHEIPGFPAGALGALSGQTELTHGKC